MFSKDNIKFNIFFYMLIFLGWAFMLNPKPSGFILETLKHSYKFVKMN